MKSTTIGRIPGLVVSSNHCVNSSIPLTFLSWNVSNASPSCMAPDPAQRVKRAPFLIRDECLSSSPDIIALQECPSPSFGRDVFGSHGYISMGTRPSHCGYVDLLVRKGLTTSSSTTAAAEAAINDDNHVNINDSKRKRNRPSTGTTTITTDFYNLPSVACHIDLPNGVTIAVSSSHLAPFKDGASERLAQCTTLMKLMTQNGGNIDNCILLGDFNARAAEDTRIENAAGGKWLDAWKCTGSDPNTKFTWNTFANRYHGDDGFRFKARFDRCYIRGGAVTVNRFGLIGNRRVDGRVGDYLSDHYGLLVGLEVAGNDREDKEEEEEEEEEEISKNTVVDTVGGEILLEPTLSTKELRTRRLIAIDRRNKSDSSRDNVVDLT